MEHKIYKKIVLVVLDGFGIASASHGNAISIARIPTIDSIVKNYPSVTLQASGPLVGLPWGEMGNSEVGHLNIGAGRIVGQDLPRITASIQNGDFFKNKILIEAAQHVKTNHSKLHLIGMISPGGVHSLDEHLYALLEVALEQGVREVYIHMFTDGRDTEEKVALESLHKLNERIDRIGVGEVATIAGRFYGMDRGGHWDQTELTYQALVNGVGETARSAEQCIQQNYDSQIFDEMIKPTVILNQGGQPIAKIQDNDAIIFFNFRSDRALQLTQVFVEPEMLPEQFRHEPLKNTYVVTMSDYRSGLRVCVAFEQVSLKNNLAEVVSHCGMKQFHIAETEKYAHVTAFFNGGQSEKFAGEERVIVSSPNNAHNYSDQPEMSALELTEKLVTNISASEFNFYLANYANPDMVGHTGNLQAAVKAVEFIDICLKRIMETVLAQDSVLIITADHGNVEQMINNKTGEIDKDHTTNPVPFLFIANEAKFKTSIDRDYINLSAEIPIGAISDIAPTILELFGLPKPPEMTGISLLNSI